MKIIKHYFFSTEPYSSCFAQNIQMEILLKKEMQLWQINQTIVYF